MSQTVTEQQFAELKRRGWPEHNPPPARGEGLRALFAQIEGGMAAQLIDSSVPETRAFWRSHPIGKALLAIRERALAAPSVSEERDHG